MTAAIAAIIAGAVSATASGVEANQQRKRALSYGKADYPNIRALKETIDEGINRRRAGIYTLSQTALDYAAFRKP